MVELRSYKAIAMYVYKYPTYIVSLVWLYCSKSEPQWLEYFKLVFFEIQNVSLRMVFENPVTY